MFVYFVLLDDDVSITKEEGPKDTFITKEEGPKDAFITKLEYLSDGPDITCKFSNITKKISLI